MYHSLSSSVDGHLVFFHILAIVSGPSMNTGWGGGACVFLNYDFLKTGMDEPFCKVGIETQRKGTDIWTWCGARVA